MYYNRSDNTRWYYLKQVLDGNIKTEKADVIFLGESRVNAGIDFKQIPNCYSLAYGGTSSIENYFILKKYVEKHSKPKTVFYSVSPRFLKEIFSFYHYAVRNDIFTSEDINEILETYNQIETDSILGSNIKWRFYLYKLNWFNYYQTDVYYSYGFASYKKNKQMIEQMNSMKGGRIHPGLKNISSELNEETRYKNFKPSPVLDRYFKKVFEFCRRNDINIIFDFMPMNESSIKKLKPEFISDYKKYIQSVSDIYPEFTISDTLYSFPDSLFGDASHLNNKGQKRYTEYVKNILTTENPDTLVFQF